MPSKAQRDLFQLHDFPKEFLSQVEKAIGGPNVQLNKVEQFILKLVIPFIRVAHCERGPQMKVRGNLILISADVATSLEKILPQSQNILPIRFKRKLTYSGHYLAEYVDRRKVDMYFQWFQKHNPLFEDITFDDELLEKFENDLRQEADTIMELSQQGSAGKTTEDEETGQLDEDDLEDEIDALLPDEENYQSNESIDDKEADISIWQQHSTVMCDKYAIPTDLNTHVNKMANLIIALEQEGALPTDAPDEIDLDHMSDDIGEFFKQSCRIDDEVVSDDEPMEEDDQLSDGEGEDDQHLPAGSTEALEQRQQPAIKATATEQRRRAFDNMSTISIAPGEMGEFKNWKGDVFLEEKAFPHLFPYGIGGYISSCLSSKKNMGFAAYCRHRVRSVDPKFRNDQIYVFFLELVKELLDIKNCQSTYLRQARHTPGLTKQHITDMRYANLERYNRSFSVFKKMRGFSSFYEAAKGNLMATIRQRGPPSLFITLSSAEYHWQALVKAVYQTVNSAPYTDEVNESLTMAQKRKLITDNVVQTTVHFQKRIEKVIKKFMKPGFFEQRNSVSNAGEQELEEEEIEDVQCDEEDREDGKEESEDAPSYFYRIEFQARGAPHAELQKAAFTAHINVLRFPVCANFTQNAR